MKGLTLFRRTTKSEGIIKLRFRLRDGRGVDLYHYSEIKERCVPSNERAQNTVAIKLRMLQAFYT